LIPILVIPQSREIVKEKYERLEEFYGDLLTAKSRLRNASQRTNEIARVLACLHC